MGHKKVAFCCWKKIYRLFHFVKKTSHTQTENIRYELQNRLEAPVNGIWNTAANQLSDIGINAINIPRQELNQGSLEGIRLKQTLGDRLISTPNTQNISSIMNVLGDLGIIHKNDGLLHIEESTLDTAIKNNLEDVKTLITKKETGVADRLEKYLGITLNTKYGTASKAKSEINSFLMDFNGLPEKSKLLIERYSKRNAIISQLNSDMGLFSFQA